MPSQRAILIDLEKNKLKFDRPHTALDKSGHIVEKSQMSQVSDVTTQEQQQIVAQEPDPVQLVVEQHTEVAEIIEEKHEEPSLDVQEQPAVLDATNAATPEDRSEEKTEEPAQVVEDVQAPKRRGRKFNTRA